MRLRPPFKEGESGNPGGRPKGYREFAEAARKVSMEGIRAVHQMAKTAKRTRRCGWLPGRRSGSAAMASQ